MDTPNVPPVKPTIDFATFEEVDIRVGTILSAEDVKRSKKLVKLAVDFGSFRRTILSGLKPDREDLQELTGKQALFVVNLKPREMMGEVSEGMLLDLGAADPISPALAVPECLVPNGAQAG